MKKHIFLIGQHYAGKSYIIQKILEDCWIKYDLKNCAKGFYTVKLNPVNKKPYTEVHTLKGERALLSFATKNTSHTVSHLI